MMQRRLGLGMWFAVLLAVSLIGACSRGSDDTADGEWTLATLGGVDAIEDVSVTMELADNGALSGSGGCNRFAGTWEEGDDRALSLSPGAMTMMSCPDEIEAQEQAFLDALATTASFRQDGDELTLRDASQQELATMTRYSPADLVEASWVLVYYNDGGQAIVSVLADTTITADFHDDGRLNGHAGCNSYNTTFETDGEVISIEPAMTTLMACDEPIMDQEAAYLTAIAQAAAHDLGERTLTLYAADGSVLASYRVEG